MATPLQRLIDKAGAGVAETVKFVDAAMAQALKEGRASEFRELGESKKTLIAIFAGLGEAHKRASRSMGMLDEDQEKARGQENN
jgi:hypothetical protein